MTTLLLLVTEEIPNPIIDDTNGYLNRILFHVDPQGRKCQAISLRDIGNVLRYRNQQIDCFKKDHDASLAKLKIDLGEDLTQTILYGECKLITLVDSPGGYNGYARIIIDFILNLRKNGGETMSFSFYSTASAAFMIVSAIEKRYSLIESEFMFHRGVLPELPENEDEIEEEEGENNQEDEENMFNPDYDEDAEQYEFDIQDMEETYGRFFSNCDEDSKNECNSLKEQCVDNMDYDAYFSGDHLLSLGVLEDCSLSSDELVNLIVENIGLAPKEGTELTRILSELKSNGDRVMAKGMFATSLGGLLTPDSPKFINPQDGSELNISS